MLYHFYNEDEPITLDPAHIFGSVEQRLALFLFEGLTGYDPQLKNPVPGVAETWRVNDDGLVYTFLLRPDARWSDGHPVTAHDFVYAWRRILEWDSDLPYTFLFFCIEGCEAHRRGCRTDPSALGFKALDDYRFEVRLVRPIPYFLWLTSFFAFSPVPAWCIARHGADWWQAGNLVSNGPFYLAHWQKAKMMWLKRNEQYWDALQVKLDEVQIGLETDEATILDRYRNNNTMHIYNVSAHTVETWRGYPDLDLSPRLAVTYLLANPAQAPVSDARIRRALSLAIERHTLSEIEKRGDVPAYTFVPPYLADYEGFTGIQPSIETARSLFEQAGFSDGQGYPELTVSYTYPDQERVLVEVTRVWAEQLGICVRLVQQPWQAYMHSLSTLDYQLITSKWVADYPDPSTFLSWFVSDCASVELGYSNPAVDRELNEALAQSDPLRRAACFRRAEQIIVAEDAIVIPLFFHANRQLYKNTLGGIYPNLFGLHPPKYIWVKDQQT